MTDYYPYEWEAIHDTNGMPVGEAVYEEKICDGIFWKGLPLQKANGRIPMVYLSHRQAVQTDRVVPGILCQLHDGKYLHKILNC
jgi:hypothetical protein